MNKADAKTKLGWDVFDHPSDIMKFIEEEQLTKDNIISITSDANLSGIQYTLFYWYEIFIKGEKVVVIDDIEFFGYSQDNAVIKTFLKIEGEEKTKKVFPDIKKGTVGVVIEALDPLLDQPSRCEYSVALITKNGEKRRANISGLKLKSE